MTDEFIVRVIRELAARDEADILHWNTDATPNINCNDFFWWGCGDAENVTPENLPVLLKALEDSPDWGGLLFCARVRGMRPQGAAYPKDPKARALFDACGPKREVDLGNPYEHPDDGGKYAYKESREDTTP